MSTWSAISARVKTKMLGIADIGNVYAQVQLAVDGVKPADILTATIDGEEKARVWLISDAAMDTSFADSSGSQRWDRVVQIEGFLQIERTGSQDAANDLAEQIVKTLGGDLWSTNLGGTVITGMPPKIVLNDLAAYLGVGCHRIRLQMPVLTYEGA